MKNTAKNFAEILNQGDAVIFSGAGMSTESGLQDFRSKTGIWANADPMRLASVEALDNDYESFLAFYKARLTVPEGVRPNKGHELIAKWEKEKFIKGVITQNVDRLHQAAGSENIAELHGSLEPVRCHRCGEVSTKENFMTGKRCGCGGRLRPGVVLFGEMLPQSAIQKAEEWSADCRSFVVLGSSLVVSPANFFPRKAKQAGAKLIIVNREETPLDYMADIVVHDEIGKFLSEAENAIRSPSH